MKKMSLFLVMVILCCAFAVAGGGQSSRTGSTTGGQPKMEFWLFAELHSQFYTYATEEAIHSKAATLSFGRSST